MRKILISLICTFFSFIGQSATYTANGSTSNWGANTTWDCGCIPSRNLSGNTIIIPTGRTITGGGNITDGGSSGTLTVNGTLNATSIAITNTGPTTINGGGTINLSGNFNHNGAWGNATNITANINATGTFTFGGGNALNITGNVSSAAFTHSGGGNVSVNGNLSATSVTKSGGGTTTITGNLTSSAGNVNVNGGSGFTVSGNSSITGALLHSGGGNVVMSGINTITGAITQSNSNLTFGGATSAGSFSQSGGVVSISSLTLTGNYSVTGGTGFTASGPVSIGGSISVSNGPQLVFQNNLSVGGNIGFTGGSGMAVSGNTSITGAYSQTSTGAAPSVFNGSFSSASIAINGANLQLNGTSTTGSMNIQGNLSGSSTSLAFSSITYGYGSICSANNASAIAALGSPVNLVTCSTVLPIVLSDFTVDYQNGKFIVDWATLQEIENDFFTIEYSLDAEIFQSVKDVNGEGTSYKTLYYQEVLSGLEIGRNDVVYFRIKQTDFDGTYTYSFILPVSLNGDNLLNAFEIFPNPTDGILTIMNNYSNKDNTISFDLKINDLQGNQVYYSTDEIINKINTIDLSILPKGAYILSIDNNNLKQKLIIQ